MGLPLLLLFLFPDIRLHCLMKINPRVVDVVYQQLGLRVSSGYPNTSKPYKHDAAGRVHSSVSRFLDTLMIHSSSLLIYYIKSASLMIKTPLGNRNMFFSNFSCTPVHTCAYGHYAPGLSNQLQRGEYYENVLENCRVFV